MTNTVKLVNLHPLLIVAGEGDADQLEKLLNQKSEEFLQKTETGTGTGTGTGIKTEMESEAGPDIEAPPAVYPDDYKYSFKDFLIEDEDHRTVLHLAAAVGNPEMALACVQVLLNSIQILMWEKLYLSGPNVKGTEKFELLINLKDKHGDTPLHVAIANEAPLVVFYLIRSDLKLFGDQEKGLANMAHLYSKDATGTEALSLIYQKVPEALKQIYDESIVLRHDNKSLSIDWSYLVGRFGDGTRARGGERRGGGMGSGKTASIARNSSKKETEYLSQVLNSAKEKGGSQLLLHPLVKLFLDIKWKKVYWALVFTIVFHLSWLSTYTIAFVHLQLQVTSLMRNSSNSSASTSPVPVPVPVPVSTTESMYSNIDANDVYSHFPIWDFLLAVAILVGFKEMYQMYILRKHYLSFERVTHVLFIMAYVIQYSYLVRGMLETAAAISNVVIILTAILMICQLGLIPVFGIQIAVFKKVIYSCAPHLPVLFLFFVGFGLSFWSYSLKCHSRGEIGAEWFPISSLLAMVPRVVAMGTGEISADENLQKIVTETTLSLDDSIFIFCFIIFIMLIVVLYFNLLVGYAVDDIQSLKEMAEELELSNRLNTIYTIECFLLTCIGIWGIAGQRRLSPFFVYPPSKSRPITDLNFKDLPTNILKELQELAFNNLKKNKPKFRVLGSVNK